MRNHRLTMLLLAVITAGATACAETGTGPTTPPDPDGDDPAVLSGTITDTRTLSADTVYRLQGIVAVDSGAVLEIPAGTTILGDIDTQPTALVVRRGGAIHADGTRDAPIIFTSSAPAGQRQRGDWGGVILNGYSYCNFSADQCVGEGNSGPYGGTDPDDSSGRMSYVRIEYCGYEVSFGNELNCLTLNGVGRGTELHHIQAHMGSDDGFEFFGGTVDLAYAIVTGSSDDSFDYSTGWQGRGQFWIAQQDPNDADTGFEVDNNEDDYGAAPRTDPRIYNVTLVGRGPDSGTAGESTKGLKLRRGTAGQIHNAIVVGFGEAGLDVDNVETYDQCSSGTLIVSNSFVYGNTAFVDPDDDDETACTGNWTLWRDDPLLVAPYDREAPDFRPSAGSPARSNYTDPPQDGFFTAVDYAGAVDPDGEPWYGSWITLEQS